jgi:hypothetical protein
LGHDFHIGFHHTRNNFTGQRWRRLHVAEDGAGFSFSDDRSQALSAELIRKIEEVRRDEIET